MFYQDNELCSRVFIQGEPGMGKSTFLTKLALDWCNEMSLQNSDHNATFSDSETLKEFAFLFYISMKNVAGQREVIEMIKTQIIDVIYMADEREEAFKLVQQILKRETCIVAMD
ncbi:hypothetical protein DPMN_130441 [Dreissena polymorpha]|uniref:NACHT domain-containing protein n=1 Tax=Dreissena polymorpha TaxID=45954 RepID=A0A9D4K1S9_DREPO|nr:hypothetical protein DPMN_130441 [Dreissena polymorpha]